MHRSIVRLHGIIVWIPQTNIYVLGVRGEDECVAVSVVDVCLCLAWLKILARHINSHIPTECHSTIL